MFTLLVYELVPESISTYLIPNAEVEKDGRLELLKLAHGKLVNADEDNEGMRFLNAALCPAKHVDDDSYFDDGCTVARVKGSNSNELERVKTHEPSKKEWRCIFDQYKQDKDTVIEGVVITRVIVSGFFL